MSTGAFIVMLTGMTFTGLLGYQLAHYASEKPKSLAEELSVKNYHSMIQDQPVGFDAGKSFIGETKVTFSSISGGKLVFGSNGSKISKIELLEFQRRDGLWEHVGIPGTTWRIKTIQLKGVDY